MSKHRLQGKWADPNSGVVFITCMGDVVHVDRGLIGTVNRPVDTGLEWRRWEV